MHNDKPRIAFCFSGQARTLDQTYLFFQNNLFDAAKEQGFDYDVFCAVEDDENVDNVNLLNPTKIEKIKSSEVEDIIEKRYGDFIGNIFPKKYCFINYSKKRLENLLQQYYKIQKSFMLAKNSGKNYDISLRIRFDIIFLNKLNFEEIMNQLDDNSVICNRYNKSITLVPIQDFYFIGGMNLINSLSSCFDNFRDLFKGHEIKTYFKIIYKLFGLLNKINICTGYKINTIVHVFAMINKIFFKSYTSEATFYDYILFCKQEFIKTQISLIVLRINTEESFVFLYKKATYEL